MLYRFTSILLGLLIVILLNNDIYALDLSNMKAHPRIFLTPERLSIMRSNPDEPHFKQLKKNCDYLINIAPSNTDTVAYAEPLALLYQITGDTRYSDKAIEFMRSYIQWLDQNFDFESDWYSFPRNPDKVFNETDYGNMNITTVSIAFDWLYNLLSSEDRRYFIEIFNKAIDSAMVRKGYGYGIPVSNHAHTKNRTELFVGLATYGDNDRAEEFINNAYNFFTTKMMPIFNKYNVGGQIYMGTAYGYSRTLPYALFNVEALKTALSIDLYAQNPWFEDVIYYIIHAQHPAGPYTYTYGTSAAGAQLEFGDLRNLQFMCFLRSNYANRISGSYLQTFMNETGRNNIDPRVSRTVNTEYQFLFNDKKINAVDYRLDLKPAYLSSGLGLFLARSNWSQNALWMSLQSGDYVGDHQYFDMGHFTVFRGRRLVSNVGFNRVLIGKYGIRQDISYLSSAGLPTGSQVEEFYDTNSYSYVKLDLTRTYYGPQFYGQIIRSKVLNQEVSKTTREAILLRPDYIIIYDRTGTISQDIQTKWVVHLDSPIVNINNNTYSCSVSGNNLYIHTIFPNLVNVTNQIVNTNFSKIEVSPVNPNKEERYLHILFAPNGSGELPAVTPIDTINMLGFYSIGFAVLFSKSDESQNTVEYTFNGNGSTRHLVANMEKSKEFKVLIDGLEAQKILSNQSGILSFETQLDGQHAVKILPSDSPITVGKPGRPIHKD